MKTRISKKAGVLGVCMLVAVFAMALTPAQSDAQAILATGVNLNAITIGPGAFPFLPINGAATFLNFVTPVAARVAVLFNAECGVRGNTNTWVEVDVFIDNVLAPPSNGPDTAFCMDRNNLAVPNVERPSINVWRVVPAGAHQVRVRARLIGGGAGENFFIDDSSTIVMR